MRYIIRYDMSNGESHTQSGTATVPSAPFLEKHIARTTGLNAIDGSIHAIADDGAVLNGQQIVSFVVLETGD